MEIEEIKEAKIKLEQEIEVLLNSFSEKCGVGIDSIIHETAKTDGGKSMFHCIELKIEI